jgi:hypothetical protein
VPSDFASIQEAIAAADDGEIICVEAGEYQESIDFLGKDITVQGTDGRQHTWLEGSGGSVVTFHSGETSDAVLRGLSVRGGEGLRGAGISIDGASPTLSELYVVLNDCSTEDAGVCEGVGVAVVNGGARLVDSEIAYNTAAGASVVRGLGVYVEASEVTAERVVIADNTLALEAATVEVSGLGLAVVEASLDATELEVSENTLEGDLLDDFVAAYGCGVYAIIRPTAGPAASASPV